MQIAPKICHGQLRTMSSEWSRFHPNRFTLGGVKVERVITVETHPKVLPIFGWSLASSRIKMSSRCSPYTCTYEYINELCQRNVLHRPRPCLASVINGHYNLERRQTWTPCGAAAGGGITHDGSGSDRNIATSPASPRPASGSSNQRVRLTRVRRTAVDRQTIVRIGYRP